MTKFFPFPTLMISCTCIFLGIAPSVAEADVTVASGFKTFLAKGILNFLNG